MLVISHFVRTIKMQYPPAATVRINCAWLESADELVQTIDSIEGHDLWVDLPTGRTKPPRPRLQWTDVREVINRSKKVRYFAISNAEAGEKVKAIRDTVADHICIIPKIETRRGVERLEEIVRCAKTDTVMLDKEDLYFSVDGDTARFDALVESVRVQGKKLRIRVLELKGVVFG
jgi:citrate lyase beta subunit